MNIIRGAIKDIDVAFKYAKVALRNTRATLKKYSGRV